VGPYRKAKNKRKKQGKLNVAAQSKCGIGLFGGVGGH